MLTGYIIEKYNNMGDAYTCRRLAEEANSIGISVRIVGVHDTILCENGVENRGKLLEERDFVINRYKWGHIKDAINGLGHRSYNRLECYKPYINKYVQLQNLSSDSFLKPKYVLGTARTEYELITSKLGTPFVAKGLESSMGREIRLIQSANDFSLLSTSFPLEKEFLFEEFISSSFGRDLRLFSFRGEAIACMKREASSDFRANVALGATVTKYLLDEKLQKIAWDIYKYTQLDVVGIDLLFGQECYYLCEINVMPGLEGIEQASSINIARLALSRIEEDFKQGGLS